MRRRPLSALLCLPLLLALAVPDEAHAQSSCSLASAITQSRNSFDWHKNTNNAGTLESARVFYRLMITFDVSPLPPWTGSRITGPAPTTTITAAEVRTFSAGSNWAPWNNTIIPALDCLEAEVTITITASPTAVTEGADAQFTLTSNPPPDAALTVSLTVSESEDFVAGSDKGDKTVTIGTSGSATYTVPTINDTELEDAGEVKVVVNTGTGYKPGISSSAKVQVNDNDRCNPSDPCITVTGTGPVTEGPGAQAVFTVHSEPAPASNLPVTLSVGDQCDFVASGGVGEKIVTINAGRTSATHRVPIHNDTDEESKDASGDLACHVSAEVYAIVGSGYQLQGGTATIQRNDRTLKFFEAQNHRADIVIIDDDNPATPKTADTPVIDIVAGAVVTEGSPATFTVTAAPAPTAGLTVNLDVFEPSSQDFVAANQEGVKTVTLGAGATSTTFTVPTVDDNTDEDDGFVQVSVNDGAGYVAGSGDAVDVRDNDYPTPAVSFSYASESISEDFGTREVSVDLTHPAPPGGLTLRYRVSGTAGAGSSNDFTIQNSGTLSIAAERRYASIPVAIRDDTAEEDSETVILTLIGGSGYTLGSTTVHTITITDNDDPLPNTPALDISPFLLNSVPEGGTDSYTVRLTTQPTGTVTITITSDNADVTVSPASLTFNSAGSNLWSTPQTVTVSASQDSDTRNDSAALLHTPSGGGYGTVGARTVGVTVIDDDTTTRPINPTLPSISISGGSAITEGGNAVFTVRASTAPTAALTVRLNVADDGTSDFLASGNEGSRTVTIAQSQTTATLRLPTQNDSTDEPNGRVTATVVSGTGYNVGSPSSATVAVNDNDRAVLPSISIAGGSAVTEGGNAVFTVSANPAPTAALTVNLTVTDDANSDFLAASNQGRQTVTFTAGAATATLTLPTQNDSTDEPNGSVTARVVNGTGYTVGRPSNATVAVNDNDVPAPVVSISAGPGITEGGTARFTLTATPAPAGNITVRVHVKNINILFPSGGSSTRTVRINGGSTSATLDVVTRDDGNDWPNGTLYATVQEGTGYTVAAEPNHAASVGVQDNDYPPNYPALSVSDASARESDRNANCAGGFLPCMTFTVTLSRALEEGERVNFSYRTRESTPRSAIGTGYLRDYYHTEGTARFAPGDALTRRFQVALVDDDRNDGGETFEFVIANSGGARIADGVGVGTISNSDPIPAAWSARFGRAVAQQAIDGITGRLDAPRDSGAQGNIGAFAFSSAGEPVETGGSVQDDALAARPDESAVGGAPGSASHSMTLGDLLAGSRFTFNGGEDGRGGSLAFWGQGSRSQFSGAERSLSMNGDVTTALLGADYARNSWLVGMALMQSRGAGGYSGGGYEGALPADGRIPGFPDVRIADITSNAESDMKMSLTAAVPYAAWRASERLKLWGAAGYGSGDMTLDSGGDEVINTGIGWTMAAAGLRSDLMVFGGASLALVSDALWARTSSEGATGLSATDAGVSRLRLGLEASRSFDLPGRGGRLTPKLELGARRDGGDAETGFGVEVGGGVAWSAPSLGMSLNIAGRALLSHEDNAISDHGFSASLAYDPRPNSARGLSLALRQDIGAQATGGLNALFSNDPLRPGMQGYGPDAETGRWTMEAGYGMPAFGGRFTGTPHVGYGASAFGREVSVGWRLAPELVPGAPELSLGVLATRSEREQAQADHGIGIEFRARW